MTSNFNGITKPTPLKNINIPPPFPTNTLPEVLKSYTDFIAETAQVSPDMPAAAILAALSVCLQGKAKIRFSPYWSEELNLYVLITAPPGERKSAVFGSITEPIHSFTAEYNERHLIDFQTYRNTKKLLETKLSKAIEKGSDIQEIRDIQEELNSLEPKKELKLITTDVTAEALASIMLDNNGNMGILSPEGGVFDVISGMYSGKVTNLNIFLSGYDGEPVKIDRKSGSVTLAHPLLTFGICAQPQVLNNVITNPNFTGKGLSQRFLFCQPESMIGRRKLVQSYNGNGAEIVENYRRLIYRLLNMQHSDNCFIELTCSAADLLESYADKIEMQMSDNGSLAEYREFFGKLTGKTLRIAGLLHLCEHDTDECVSGKTMSGAIAISEYFGKQYLKMMCADNYDDTPQYVIDKITAKAKRDGINIISLRDIKRTVRKLSEEQVTDALEILCDKNFLFRIPPPRDGSRKKESYEINPYLLNNERK